MSTSFTGAPPALRVRQQARRALALMAFSAAMSVALSLVLVALMTLGQMTLGHQG